MRINSVASAMILVGIALLAKSALSLSLLLVRVGAVYGLANPSANKALAELVQPERRGLIFRPQAQRDPDFDTPRRAGGADAGAHNWVAVRLRICGSTSTGHIAPPCKRQRSSN